MVHTCKTQEEWQEKYNETEIACGCFMLNEEINIAKSNRLFNNLRKLIRNIEDEGAEIYYYCTDTIMLRGNGKWLSFAFFNINETINHKVLSAIVEIKNNRRIDLDNIPEYISDSQGIISGTPSCCPLF